MTTEKKANEADEAPQVTWDPGERQFSVRLPVKKGTVIEAKWKLTTISVVRIREKGVEDWGPGFETPFNTCSFSGLKPNTDYETEVRQKNDAGEGAPAISSFRTNPEGK